MLAFLRSSSPVLVMKSSISVPICNHFHVIQDNSKNNHFLQGYRCLTPACASLFESRASGLKLLKSTFNGETFIANCLDLYPAISVQFTLEMRVAAQNRKNKFNKTPYFGGSRSFKVIDVDISKKHVASACYDVQHVCSYLQPFLH